MGSSEVVTGQNSEGVASNQIVLDAKEMPTNYFVEFARNISLTNLSIADSNTPTNSADFSEL
jgi:hypothetical protein